MYAKMNRKIKGEERYKLHSNENKNTNNRFENKRVKNVCLLTLGCQKYKNMWKMFWIHI